MGTVTEINDGLSYITDDDDKGIQGVSWAKRNQDVEFWNDGRVESFIKVDGSGIQKHELKHLMIMWLALNYPDCLKFDDLEKEELIRKDTERKG